MEYYIGFPTHAENWKKSETNSKLIALNGSFVQERGKASKNVKIRFRASESSNSSNDIW